MLHLTECNFQSEINRSSLPVVVIFYAAWCGRCAMTKPVVEDMEPEYRGRIRFCEVNVDESAKLAEKYGADIVPFFLFFRNGKLLGELNGPVSEATLRRCLHKIFR